MQQRKMLNILLLLAVAFSLIFLFGNLDATTAQYVISKRIPKLIAIILTGSGIAISSMIFQTITGNRILTPSILGLDSLFMLLQTGIIFLFGSLTLHNLGPNVNFLMSVGLMVGFSLILYRLMFKGEAKNIFYLLLVGMILGTLFQSVSSFMQQILDPNEFLFVQDKMFASFSSINEKLLYTSIIIMSLTIAYAFDDIKKLDVLALGREHAINLGLDYEVIVKRLLKVVAVLIAVPTALVGPITFLGLLVVNIAYQLIKDYRHQVLIPAAILISIIALVGGQVMVERVFHFSTTISVLINFVGGTYFIYMLLKEERL
ncbi:MAG: iron chelate uptake ABC transporter family permease subunit [Turicibacter sp.]